MDPVVATAVGILIVGSVALWSRFSTGIALTPAFFFFAAIFIHCTLDPILRVSQGLNVTSEVMHSVMLYNLLCISAVAFGFIVTTMWAPFRFEGFHPTASLMSRNSFQLLLWTCVFLLFVALLLLWSSGAINERRGAFGTQRPITFDIARDILTYTTFVSAFLITNAFLSKERSGRYDIHLSFIPAFMIFISDILTFGRQNSLIIIATTAIILVSRMGKLNVRYVSVALILFGFTAFFGLLRRLGVGIFDISYDTFYLAYVSGRLTLSEFFYFVFTTIPGQEVFINVVKGFDTSQLWYGYTYFWNMISRMTFGSVLPEGYQTATSWYQDNFVSSESYGRDFSMIAETYVNFGENGYLVFVPIGVLIAIMSRLALKSQNTLVVCWAAYMIVNMIVGLRNDSYPVFTRTLFSIIPIWLFLLALREPAIAFARRSPARA